MHTSCLEFCLETPPEDTLTQAKLGKYYHLPHLFPDTPQMVRLPPSHPFLQQLLAVMLSHSFQLESLLDLPLAAQLPALKPVTEPT